MALEIESTYSNIAQILKEDFFVDDLLTGADSVEDASYICENVSKDLKTNEPRILEMVLQRNLKFNTLNSFGLNKNAKTLGLVWSGVQDFLLYKIRSFYDPDKLTKRSVLSHLAQIFDPLGLLSSCLISTKILLQQLWLAKLSWDESLPQVLHSRWLAFHEGFHFM